MQLSWGHVKTCKRSPFGYIMSLNICIFKWLLQFIVMSLTREWVYPCIESVPFFLPQQGLVHPTTGWSVVVVVVWTSRVCVCVEGRVVVGRLSLSPRTDNTSVALCWQKCTNSRPNIFSSVGHHIIDMWSAFSFTIAESKMLAISINQPVNIVVLSRGI